MPRIPLLGHQDEADPEVNRQHVALAAEHGINTFIMDWYWYEEAPCFERQLNDGLIPALQESTSKFYLMWANHDANSLWDMHTDEKHPLWTGQVNRAALEPMWDRIIEKYFSLDCHYKIDDKPVFSIYALGNFVTGLGGMDGAADALAWMRQRCVDKGLPGVHLQAIVRKGQGIIEGGAILPNRSDAHVAHDLGFDSGTTYQYVNDSYKQGDFVVWAEKAMSFWPAYEELGTYYPHVSIGWDDTQRNPSKDFAVVNATPAAFEACLWKCKQYLDARPDQLPLVTINSWNEWTEGSYLLPDMRYGYQYLQAVRNVFGSRS